MQIKTSELTGAALDWAVCAAVRPDDLEKSPLGVWCVGYWSEGPREVAENIPRYSTDWSQGGPLIDSHRVSIIYSDELCDPCAWTDETGAWGGREPLTAACRAIVAAKIGDTVDVPEELTHV